jgi:hypothetical protein
MKQIIFQGLDTKSTTHVNAKTFMFETEIIIDSNGVVLGAIRGLMATITALNDGRTHFISGWLASGNEWEVSTTNGDLTYGFSLLNERDEPISTFSFISPAIKCYDDRFTHYSGNVIDVKFSEIKSISFKLLKGTWNKCN